MSEVKMFFRAGFNPLASEMPQVVFVESCINKILGGIADEINSNKGFVEYFHKGADIELRAFCVNPVVNKKMTTKLQIVLNSLKGLN